MINLEGDNLIKIYQTYLDKGKNYFLNNNFLKAFMFFTRALTIGELKEDRELIILAKKEIANLQFKTRDLRKAMEFYTDLMEYKDFVDEKDIIQFQNRIGLINLFMGKYSKASDIFENLCTSQSTLAKRKAFNNMGVVHYYRYKYFDEECIDKALRNFQKAYQFSIEDRLMQHKSLKNMGMALYEKKDFSTALDKLKRSLLFADTYQQKADSLNEIAKVNIELLEYQEAQECLRKAEKILLNAGDGSLIELSRNLFINGLLAKKQGRTETAYSHFQAALQGFIEKEIYTEAVLASRAIYKMFKEANPERANFYADQYKFYLNYLDPMD